MPTRGLRSGRGTGATTESAEAGRGCAVSDLTDHPVIRRPRSRSTGKRPRAEGEGGGRAEQTRISLLDHRRERSIQERKDEKDELATVISRRPRNLCSMHSVWPTSAGRGGRGEGVSPCEGVELTGSTTRNSTSGAGGELPPAVGRSCMRTCLKLRNSQGRSCVPCPR